MDFVRADGEENGEEWQRMETRQVFAEGMENMGNGAVAEWKGGCPDFGLMKI